ncbi:MAG: DUF4350 domain-containing protein [Snowella sp.]|nr:DUF4350 domain-containing protein [Snowella sp.]
MIKSFNFPRPKGIGIAAIALVCLLLLTIMVAPSRQSVQQGSTYGRDPSGYGAWAAFMEKRGTPIQRWQKSFEQLTQQSEKITFLQVHNAVKPNGFGYDTAMRKWVGQGNRLIIVGIWQPATTAPFTTMQPSRFGNIAIDTSRRAPIRQREQLLGDRFGAIVWKEQVNRGEIIFAIPSHFAANAYQDYPSNYEFLADLATQGGYPIWVDEYLHGYKDREVIQSEIGNIWQYFAKTPLVILVIQGIVLLVILVWAGNRRFGQAIALVPPTRNNSEVYIEALAGVLEKAESADFVVSRLQEAEQKSLQSQLGLGSNPLPDSALMAAWEQQTRQSSVTLRSLLHPSSRPKNNRDLRLWLEKWQTIKNINRVNQ